MKHLKLFEDFNEETALNPVEITDFSMESGESNQFESNEKKSNKLTKKEKELAAKYPPKNKITRGDIITAAIENAGKKDKKDKKDDKKDDKNSGKLTAAQKKLPEALRKAIEKRK